MIKLSKKAIEDIEKLTNYKFVKHFNRDEDGMILNKYTFKKEISDQENYIEIYLNTDYATKKHSKHHILMYFNDYYGAVSYNDMPIKWLRPLADIFERCENV